MSNVICSKCGAKATSKCPYCRTIFPEDQTKAILSHLLKFPVHKDGWATGTITLRADSNEEYFRTFIHLAELLKEIGIDKYCCDHDWIFMPGCKSSIDCGHEAIQN